MATNVFNKGELPKNYQQKWPVVMVLDVSVSMKGSPIDELNKGLRVFNEEIQNDMIASERLDLAIVSFGSDVKLEHNFDLMADYKMPKLEIRGSTNLIGGVRKGIELIAERKKWYKESSQAYYRPYLILITDGFPDNSPKTDGLNEEIEKLARDKKLNFWPIGVQGADMDMLDEMAVPGVGASLPSLKLSGIKFIELFQWPGTSFSKISNSKEDDVLDVTPENKDQLFVLKT